jgi:NAD(P)-dependent dehydrogenase (short-subunit alcohol dehydrogenase family)
MDQTKTVVISGGTSGMGRATALARHALGDRVIVLGSSAEPDLPAGITYVRADLSVVGEVSRVVSWLRDLDRIDALALFANRLSPRRVETVDGLEHTFALYYLSRYLLSHRLAPLLDAAPTPVIINVAGVGSTAGGILWDDSQQASSYRMIRAQIQACRANDLLGVDFAAAAAHKARYVLYHPGFTRSGLDHHPSPVVRFALKTLARFKARPVAESIRPIVEWIDHPPTDPLTAVDRGAAVDLSLSTLDPAAASRLAEYTRGLVS